MTDAMLGPLLTLVSIAIPVGVASTPSRQRWPLLDALVVLLRQRSYDRATAGERLYWTLRFQPGSGRRSGRRGAADRGASSGSDADVSLGQRLAAASVSRSGGLAAAPVGRSRRRAARAIGRDGRRRRLSWGRARSSRRRWSMPAPSLRLAVRGEPPEAARPGPSSNLGAILVELLARLPDGACRGLASPRGAPLPPAKDQFDDAGPGRDAPRLIPQPAVESRTPPSARALPARAPGPSSR